MNNQDLISSFAEFKEFKNIDRETLMRILEEVFKKLLDKQLGAGNYDLIINVDKGDLEVYHLRTIVEDGELQDPKTEIELSVARKSVPDLEVGEEYAEPMPIEQFGRRDILAIRQTLVSKIREHEKSLIIQKYKDLVGQIVLGEVYQPWSKEIIVLDEDRIELVLPRSEQIPSDRYRKGDTVRAVVLKAEMVKENPVIVLSRVAPVFLERLLEAEVPEINEGLINIRKIVREPGERAKVAVESIDDRIDPVGSCVGVKGSRIHGIVRELRNESIDVLNYTPRVDLMIQRALSPAKISSIKIDNETKHANVYMEPDQVSLAIGKGGHNIKLAGKLVGYNVEVNRSSSEFDEDVDLREFNDEIDQWVIDVLRENGLDTAKSVLSLPHQELIDRTDLEEETINEVLRVLQAEFEDEE